jgi:alkylhydroperoxidase/carboxymuconolactone decarboxylase family protein YurZ
MAQAEHQVDTEGIEAGPVSRWAQFPSLANSKLFDEYANRLVANRDMHVIVTAASETGVGKTTLAVVLALLWDQHGWTADKAAVASAEEYIHLYDQVEPGSVLLLDEAEIAADNRRGTTTSSVELSQAFAGKRYRQVFGIMTAPTKSWVDKRMGADAADYWIQAQETDRGRAKGEAIVYRLKSNEHYNTDYTKRHEVISWPRLDNNRVFQELDRRKKERLGGEYEAAYVHRDKVEEMKSNWWNKATMKARYHILKAMAEQGITQTQIAEVLQSAEHVEGLSQSQVSRTVNTSSFEEAYSRA